MKLRKSDIDRIPHPASGQTFYWDDELTGFGLRVTPTKKTYIVQRRVSGRTVRATIAPHGILTPDQARKRALQLLGEMVGGLDHNLERKRQDLRQTTLKEAYESYLNAKPRTPNTLRDYKRAMDVGFADWRDRPIAKLSREMIERRFEALSATSKAQANQFFRFLRALLNYAMEKFADPQGEPLIPSNPCNRLTALDRWHRIKGRTGHIKPDQLKAWFSVTAHVEQDSVHRNTVRDLCVLLLLTGLREQEGASLRWKDVDLSARRLTITKTKNHHQHTLPIGPWLTDLLARRRLSTGLSEYVFPADNQVGHVKHHRKDVLALSAAAEVEFRLHDLRRTFASIVNHQLERSLTAYTVKRLLNHSTGNDVTANYIQFGNEDLRGPMQMVEEFVLRCAGIHKTAPVIDLTKKIA